MRALLRTLLAITPASVEPATKAQRAGVLTWARAFFADPYSLRSTAISDNYVGKDQLHVGETTGGSFTTSSCYAPQVVMKPFPELAKIQ